MIGALCIYSGHLKKKKFFSVFNLIKFGYVAWFKQTLCQSIWHKDTSNEYFLWERKRVHKVRTFYGNKYIDRIHKVNSSSNHK